MASSEADSRLKQVLVPALEKIIKNASWRKHSKLAHECKSVIETLTSPPKSQSPSSDDAIEPEASVPGPIHDGGPVEYSLAESESILRPLISAASSGVLKIADPAVDAVQRLIAHGFLRGEADSSGGAPEAKLLASLIEAVCKCHDFGDDAVILVWKAKMSKLLS